jgi:hypothetical protein
LALPGLVAAKVTQAWREPDGHSRTGRVLAQLDAGTASSRWLELARIAEEVFPRVRRGAALRKALRGLPELGPEYAKSNHALRVEGVADQVEFLTERLLGQWLGRFDLVVVDEAHKSRGTADEPDGDDEEVDGSVLTRLLGNVLRQPPAGRRLCVTATPMELELSQWIGLLRRARSGADEAVGNRVLDALDDAAKAAAAAPDEGPRLETLCGAAEAFRAWLAPYVTRRRRSEERLLRRFREAAARVPGFEQAGASAHPHRDRAVVSVPWNEAARGEASPWLEVLLAAEAMSHAARGLPQQVTKAWPPAVKAAYTKLAAGHVSVDLADDDLALPPVPTTVDAHLRDKVERTAYWLRQLQNARSALAAQSKAGGAGDCEHPRILAAAQEIERWTARREKVLVFGVYLGPLRLLRDVLDVRHAIRAADGGRPVARAIHEIPRLFDIAVRHLPVLQREGALRGALANATPGLLRVALARCHRDHRNNQKALRAYAPAHVARWLADRDILGGELATRSDRGLLEDHLVSFMLDRMLAGRTSLAQPRREQIDALAQEFLRESLRPLLEEADPGDEADLEEKQHLRLVRVRRALDIPEGRHAPFAELLQGDTDHARRHYVKAAFNREGSSPYILLAQSQVGREGLNLHLACRVVIQFHAEWNPAVLEQQIGRVDRKRGRWEALAKSWLERGAKGRPERIEVRQLVFEGTYDAYQWDRVARRRHAFDASLFGALLPEEAWAKVPPDRQNELIAAAPDFSPRRRK